MHVHTMSCNSSILNGCTMQFVQRGTLGADILNIQKFPQPNFGWKKIYAKKSIKIFKI